MITRDMVMAVVLARLQAEGRELKSLTKQEMDAIAKEAVDDLKFADDVVNAAQQ